MRRNGNTFGAKKELRVRRAWARRNPKHMRGIFKPPKSKKSRIELATTSPTQKSKYPQQSNLARVMNDCEYMYKRREQFQEPYLVDTTTRVARKKLSCDLWNSRNFSGKTRLLEKTHLNRFSILTLRALTKATIVD